MKRITLFVLTNLAVVFVLSIVLRVLGITNYLYARGIDVASLLIFSLIFGFAGSIISLLMSKNMAKMSVGAQVIDVPANRTEQWLVETVGKLAHGAGIAMPEVAIYEGEPNAFATGAFRNSALVAVSTGLLRGMQADEIEAVLGHEISHVANGDMVTMTLLQGVLNTFVIFISRVVGFFVDSMLSRNDDRRSYGMGFFMASMICQVLFGFIASLIVAWYSRRREYRADAGSADLLSSPQPMIRALQRLEQMQPGALPKNMAAFGIGSPNLMSLFATHPPLEKRIQALRERIGG